MLERLTFGRLAPVAKSLANACEAAAGGLRRAAQQTPATARSITSRASLPVIPGRGATPRVTAAPHTSSAVRTAAYHSGARYNTGGYSGSRFSLNRLSPFQLGLLFVAFQIFFLSDDSPAASAPKKSNEDTTATPRIPSLTLAEFDALASSDDYKDRTLVTYKGLVLDVTDFKAAHPGGEHRLDSANGKPLEVFWAKFSHDPEVLRRFAAEGLIQVVGRLNDADYAALMERFPSDDPYVLEPACPSEGTEVYKTRPRNWAPKQLKAALDGDVEHYGRKHGPTTDASELTSVSFINGDGEPQSLRLDELALLEQHTVTTVITCAGNRRKEVVEAYPDKPVSGIPWDGSALYEGTFSGPKFLDVLDKMGIIDPNALVKITGTDGFETCIPRHQIDPDAVLALSSPEHELGPNDGGPIRLILPGFYGFMSTQQVVSIKSISSAEATAFPFKYFASFAKCVAETASMQPYVGWRTNPTEQAKIGHPPEFHPHVLSSSQILSAELARSDDGEESIKIEAIGYSGQSSVTGVEVSVDGGETWQEMTEDTANYAQKTNPKFALHRFSASVAVPSGDGDIQVLTRVLDAAHGDQSPQPAVPWYNTRGLYNNSYGKAVVSRPEKTLLGEMLRSMNNYFNDRTTAVD